MQPGDSDIHNPLHPEAEILRCDRRFLGHGQVASPGAHYRNRPEAHLWRRLAQPNDPGLLVEPASGTTARTAS